MESNLLENYVEARYYAEEYIEKPGDLAPYISIVIPAYDEADNLGPLYQELTAALEELDYRYEVIIVDDGSHDTSFIRLKEIQAKDPRWRIFRLRRNFGQTAALTAGFDAVCGQVVITMDADLQNDPRDIGKLLKKIDEGYDIVCGWRTERKEPFLIRRLPSMMANRLISRTTQVKLHDYGCTLKAYRSDVVKNIKLYGELHRFIPAIASWMGIVICEVPVNDRARRFGKSKYGIGRTFRVILDLFTVSFLLRFSTKPLRMFGSFGMALGSIGGLLGLALVYVRLFQGEAIGDRPLLLLAVLLVILGVQIFSIGLVAEMVMRVYHEPQGKPTYVVRECLDAAARKKE
jgi:glycosyltransferase involved in cell wall biosynthesis